MTIPDSTEIRPNMVYTKVWHMRNNGSMPWPALTRVVHTGGERMRVGMRDTNSVALKVKSLNKTATQEKIVRCHFGTHKKCASLCEGIRSVHSCEKG